MFELNKKDSFSIILDIKGWQAKYIDVENLPIDFYLKYKDLLFSYKSLGKSKEEVLSFFYKIAEDNRDISDFVYEVVDLIEGYCRPDFRVWQNKECEFRQLQKTNFIPNFARKFEKTQT